MDMEGELFILKEILILSPLLMYFKKMEKKKINSINCIIGYAAQS